MLYRDYTRVNYKVVKDYQSNEDEPFDAMKDILFDLYDSPDVEGTTKALEDNLRGLKEVDEKYINCAKRNLKRKIENLLTGFSFLTVNSRLLVGPRAHIVSYSIYCPRFATSIAAWRRGVDNIYLRPFKRITGINLWTVSQHHEMRYAFMILFSLIFFALLIFFSWILQIVS